MSRERVYPVQRVLVSSQKTDPPAIRIDAAGIARSSGWTSPELVRHHHVQPPADGIYEFDFTAIRPLGMTLPQMSAISASHTLTAPPADLRGVRVCAETDKQEAPVK